MARQIDTRRIVPKRLFRNGQYFHGVSAPEIFPIETVRSAIGRGDQVQPALGRVGRCLPNRFDRRAVQGQHDGRRRIAIDQRFGRRSVPRRSPRIGIPVRLPKPKEVSTRNSSRRPIRKANFEVQMLDDFFRMPPIVRRS